MLGDLIDMRNTEIRMAAMEWDSIVLILCGYKKGVGSLKLVWRVTGVV